MNNPFKLNNETRLAAISMMHKTLVPEYSQKEFVLCFIVTALLKLEKEYSMTEVKSLLALLYPDRAKAQEFHKMLQTHRLLDEQDSINLRGREYNLKLLYNQQSE